MPAQSGPSQALTCYRDSKTRFSSFRKSVNFRTGTRNVCLRLKHLSYCLLSSMKTGLVEQYADADCNTGPSLLAGPVWSGLRVQFQFCIYFLYTPDAIPHLQFTLFEQFGLWFLASLSHVVVELVWCAFPASLWGSGQRRLSHGIVPLRTKKPLLKKSHWRGAGSPLALVYRWMCWLWI